MPRRGQPRTRILYWFRTPPGVRVGRSALDEDAIRLIEAHNPQVEFDWTRILKGQDPTPEPRSAPPADRRSRPRPRDSSPALPPPQRQVERVRPPEPIEPIRERPPVPPIYPDPEPVPAPTELAADPLMPVPDGPMTAAQARLGSEGLSRLRARHSEVLARISEKVTDPVRRDELKTEAERLNPDTWVTDAEVSAGLEAYEAVFESVRGVVGRRRKRRRRPAPTGPEDAVGGESTIAADDAGTEEAEASADPNQDT